MKRYLVFASSEYYPSGGWEDFIEDFDDLECAKIKAKSQTGRGLWVHIVDTQTKEIIEEL